MITTYSSYNHIVNLSPNPFNLDYYGDEDGVSFILAAMATLITFV